MSTVCRQQHLFWNRERVFLWKCQIFEAKKNLGPRETRTPQPSYSCRMLYAFALSGKDISYLQCSALQWRHNECYGVSNHRRLDCLLNRLFMRGSKKTSELCVTGLCDGNLPVTCEFSAQRASDAENVSIWWHTTIYTDDDLVVQSLRVFRNVSDSNWNDKPQYQIKYIRSQWWTNHMCVR